MSLAGEIAAGQGLAGVASMIFFGRGILSLANRSRWALVSSAVCRNAERLRPEVRFLRPADYRSLPGCITTGPSEIL